MHAAVRASLAFVVLLVGIEPARADPERCSRILRREEVRFAGAARNAVRDCEARALAGSLPAGTDCRTDPGVTVATGAAAARARARIAAVCCGPDRTCGTPDDESLAALGWTSPSCPDLESAGCTDQIAHPGDVATCLTCAGDVAAKRVFELLQERFTPAAPGGSLARCQGQVSRASAVYFGKRGRLLRRCWEKRARGAHGNDCPVPGDGRVARALDRAADVLARRICRDCGGADRRCGGGDDLAPPTIGFLAECPDVTPTAGASCAGSVATLEDLLACTTCVSAFLADCVDRLVVPGFAPYPAACNPPRGTCSAGVECETSLDCPATHACLDNGSGTTRYCVGPACGGDPDCGGGSVCRPWCTAEGCGPSRCQCPGFGCSGPDELCIDGGGLACRKICTQDSDCVEPFGDVCINPGFGFGVCIGTEPCE